MTDNQHTLAESLTEHSPEIAVSIEESRLTQAETRQILTPFAFEIDKSLFGVELASPAKRAFAILFDLICIALLSAAPGELLAVVIAITLFQLGSKKRAKVLGKQKGKKRRMVLRIFAAFIVFVILIDVLPQMLSPFTDNHELYSNSKTANVVNLEGKDLTISESLTFSALTAGTLFSISESQCQNEQCWQQELSPFIEQFAQFSLKEESLTKAVQKMVNATALAPEQQNRLEQELISTYRSAFEKNQTMVKENKAQNRAKNTAENTVKALALQQSMDHKELGKGLTEHIAEQASAQPLITEKPVYSVIEWVKGLVNDLGLGFGWAAFYFTVFTALWHGQTPGKKVLKIQVLQLDGTPLSLWDSFGRYGGYGAGLATGLLGFIQIFWDVNRQAIQDKISATVVINIKQSQTKAQDKMTCVAKNEHGHQV